MEIDTPARLAIVGAGPTGIEAALYARFLGYEVLLLERGRVCERLRRAGNAALAQPAGECVTSLGLAALEAQDEAYDPPLAMAQLAAEELVAQYFAPLAASDLVAEGLRTECEVLSVLSVAPLPVAMPPLNDDADPMADGDELDDESDDGDAFDDDEPEEDDAAPVAFELKVRDPAGAELTLGATAVIDATGDDDDAARAWLAGLAGKPGVFRLGARSASGPWSFAEAHEQIRKLFAELVGRENLNLYRTIRK